MRHKITNSQQHQHKSGLEGLLERLYESNRKETTESMAQRGQLAEQQKKARQRFERWLSREKTHN